jgi:hypothetical protein
MVFLHQTMKFFTIIGMTTWYLQLDQHNLVDKATQKDKNTSRGLDPELSDQLIFIMI